MKKSILSWTLRGIAAVIMLQTLYFKFTASPESVYIFTRVGLEPAGRIGIGVAELIASILLLYPKTIIFGALLGVGIISGALMFHLTRLGIVIMNDGGQLFYYAVIVEACCLILVWLYKEQFPYWKVISPKLNLK